MKVRDRERDPKEALPVEPPKPKPVITPEMQAKIDAAKAAKAAQNP